MLAALLIYVAFLLGIGIYTGLKEKDYEAFVVAGRSQSREMVLLSLMATMIGGSATFGIAETGMQLGFPAFWWLGVGSVGLLLQSWLVSARVRDFKAYTLADIGRITVGEGARLAICIVIAVSWLGVIAGQFVALSQIFAVMTGKGDNSILLVVVALTVVMITAAGGQLSVMRTDAVQFIVLFFGVMAAFFYLHGGIGSGCSELAGQVDWFNARFTPLNGLYLLFVVGGTYFIGPDVLSRSMAAKDGASARSASMIAAGVLLIFNFLIVGLALWGRNYISDTGGMNPLVYILQHKLPIGLAILLALGLVSALLSSASTCLITTASIIQNDILRQRSMKGVRLLVCVAGILAIFIALARKDIIAILTGAYSIYAPGVVCPLFLAIHFYGKRKIHQGWWLLAVAVGGICGVAANFFIDFYWLPLIGMFLSLSFGIVSVLCGKKASGRR